MYNYTRVFGYIFIEKLKRVEVRIRRKSRLVSQKYSNMDASGMETKEPTVRKYSQCLMISLSTSMERMEKFLRDRNQAYV